MSATLPNGSVVDEQVTEDWSGKTFELPTFVDTLQVEEDWSGKTFELPTFVDTLQVEEDWSGKTFELPEPEAVNSIGTAARPTAFDLAALFLGDGTPYSTSVDSLLGVTFGTAQTQDGTLVFDGTTGQFSGEATIWIDGNQHPVTAVEYTDSEGVRRPVTEWHLGPR